MISSSTEMNYPYDNNVCEFDIDFGEVYLVGEGDFEEYGGEYEFTPSENSKVIPTANKLVKKDIVVNAVPYAEVTNPSNGVTVTIL